MSDANISLLDRIQGKHPKQLPKDLIDFLSFNKISNKWIIEDPTTNEELEYNSILGRWLIPISQEVDENDIINVNSVRGGGDEEITLKRKSSGNLNNDNGDDATKEFKKLKKAKLDELKIEKQQLKSQLKNRNTCIYANKLPLDITFDELEIIFSKYGVISEDFKTGLKKIKMYETADGEFKGDCLVEYLKEESCDLAIEMLNGEKLNASDEVGVEVSKAEFSTSGKETRDENTKNKGDKEKPKLNLKEKLQLKKKINKINSNLSNWSDDEDEDPELIRKKKEKIVIFKNCFKLEELKTDPATILDIKEDILEGCESIGAVTNIIIYDLEQEGIVSVRFKNSIDADKCVKLMNGRYFDGAKLEVDKYNGYSKYMKSTGKDEENEEERLKKFGEWLEK